MEQETQNGEESPIEYCKDFNNNTNGNNSGGLKYDSYQRDSLDIGDGNKYIIISLNRFVSNSDNKSVKRVNDSSFNVDHEVVIDGKNFSLIGALLHSGDTTERGHYIYQTYNDDGSVLNTYNDKYMGVRNDKIANPPDKDDKIMTLNLNSYVLLYRNDGDVSPEAASAPAAAPEAEASTEEAPAQSSVEAPIAQQKGKGKILKVVLKFDNGDETYDNFELGQLNWVPNPKSFGGNKKSRKPKSKKIRLRKTRRRKH